VLGELLVGDREQVMIHIKTDFDPDRFIIAQSQVIDVVLKELQSGKKETHWIWFVFPQLKGLGKSATAEFYGIEGLSAARSYMTHPLLRERYEACLQAVLDSGKRNPVRIFGELDALKFHSSLTLFDRAMPDHPLVKKALEVFFDGIGDFETLRRLNDY
jgi:uncharacterized protein (DUF1810 family)